uniref:Uncharacterized protein n=1 Tax=Pyxicephalus adspersus TaxID=30357 RepID=A0AAV3A791_PYXAD|nr:TPA: hypothetical protein GDO54_011197 [Pyxicephalus adspersus]
MYECVDLNILMFFGSSQFIKHFLLSNGLYQLIYISFIPHILQFSCLSSTVQIYNINPLVYCISIDVQSVYNDIIFFRDKHVYNLSVQNLQIIL